MRRINNCCIDAPFPPLKTPSPQKNSSCTCGMFMVNAVLKIQNEDMREIIRIVRSRCTSKEHVKKNLELEFKTLRTL